MVSESDEVQFKIINFDWARQVNVVKYPLFVSKKTWRPKDAKYEEPILAEHDEAMLVRIGC